MEIDPAGLSTHELDKVLTESILPRPIAWVSTVDPAGQANLAPFSFFTVATVKPPVRCFAPMLDDDRAEKHTLANIRQTGEFVVNIVSCDLVEHMDQTSALPVRGQRIHPGGSHPAGLDLGQGALCAGSTIKYECTLRQVIGFGSEPMAGNNYTTTRGRFELARPRLKEETS
jgi:flavin reductase (DIM6/NTAB) family NADH-FMN oxidoreductase RutF